MAMMRQIESKIIPIARTFHFSEPENYLRPAVSYALNKIQKGMEDLSPKEAKDFGTNFVRFLSVQADERSLPRPGSVEGRPKKPIGKEVTLTSPAERMMAAVKAIARLTKEQNPVWAIFEDQAISAYYKGLLKKLASPNAAPRQPDVIIFGF